MKILITGGSGILAKSLEVDLKKKGHQIILASSKNKKSHNYFDLNQGYDVELLNGITAVVHCSNNPDYVFNSIEENFLRETVSKGINLIYIGSTSSYLVNKNKYGAYKRSVETFILKIGGSVLTCGLIHGENFRGQISTLESKLSRFPLRIVLTGSKSVYLTEIKSIVNAIDLILTQNKNFSGRVLVLDSDSLEFNDLLNKIGGQKRHKIVLSAKLIAITLKLLPFNLNHFNEDRFKGILSDFEAGLFSNTRIVA